MTEDTIQVLTIVSYKSRLLPIPEALQRQYGATSRRIHKFEFATVSNSQI